MKLIRKIKVIRLFGNFCIAVGLALLASSCNKIPTADFAIDKSEYVAGEVVKLENKSTDAYSYKWTLPDGQTSSAENVNYTIHVSTLAGVYTVSLQATSRKGDKIAEAAKKYTVK